MCLERNETHSCPFIKHLFFLNSQSKCSLFHFIDGEKDSRNFWIKKNIFRHIERNIVTIYYKQKWLAVIFCKEKWLVVIFQISLQVKKFILMPKLVLKFFLSSCWSLLFRNRFFTSWTGSAWRSRRRRRRKSWRCPMGRRRCSLRESRRDSRRQNRHPEQPGWTWKSAF